MNGINPINPINPKVIRVSTSQDLLKSYDPPLDHILKGLPMIEKTVFSPNGTGREVGQWFELQAIRTRYQAETKREMTPPREGLDGVKDYVPIEVIERRGRHTYGEVVDHVDRGVLPWPLTVRNQIVGFLKEDLDGREFAPTGTRAPAGSPTVWPSPISPEDAAAQAQLHAQALLDAQAQLCGEDYGAALGEDPPSLLDNRPRPRIVLPSHLTGPEPATVYDNQGGAISRTFERFRPQPPTEPMPRENPLAQDATIPVRDRHRNRPGSAGVVRTPLMAPMPTPPLVEEHAVPAHIRYDLQMAISDALIGEDIVSGSLLEQHGIAPARFVREPRGRLLLDFTNYTPTVRRRPPAVVTGDDPNTLVGELPENLPENVTNYVPLERPRPRATVSPDVMPLEFTNMAQVPGDNPEGPVDTTQDALTVILASHWMSDDRFEDPETPPSDGQSWVVNRVSPRDGGDVDSY